MSETRKRGRQWRHVKQKSVEPGVSGLLFTCSGSEKHAVREAYNLITTLFEQQPSTAGHSDVSQSMHNDRDGACGDASESASDCDDVADVIKRFCSQARESRTMADHKRRLRQRPTGVNNCIFLAFDDELVGSIYSFADRIVSMALEGPCCRLLQRVIPVEVTCQVDMSAVSREVYRLVAKHFVADSDGKWPTYSVEFKARNNSSVKRSVALNMVCETVAQIAPLCRACLQQPDIAVLFQVLHKTVLLSCIRQFHQRRKMNLHCERQSSNDTEKKPLPKQIHEQGEETVSGSSDQNEKKFDNFNCALQQVPEQEQHVITDQQ